MATPLPGLLAHAVLGVHAAFEDGRDTSDPVTLLLWSDFLRALPDEGISLTDLPAATRVSRRAVKTWLRFERAGWFHVEEVAPRRKELRLTEAGRSRRDVGAQRASAAEAAWCARHDEADVAALRVALEALVGALDLELPHYPMKYGTADGSVIGGRAVAATPGPPRIPPHGSDWVPVLRDGDSATGLPLTALLSQALMAFTIDVEEHTGVPMWCAAVIADAFAAGPLPLEEVPPALGVDGSGRTSLERHGVVRVTGRQERIAALTSVGSRIRDGYEPLLAGVRKAWSARHGPVVDELESVLGRIDDGTMPDHVRIGFRPDLAFHDVSLRRDGDG